MINWAKLKLKIGHYKKKMKKELIEEIGVRMTLIVFVVGLLWLSSYTLTEAAKTNHEPTERPDYKIETVNGLEYPKY